VSMRAPEGLAHCEAILRAQPDNLRAFELAAQAAASCGDPRAAAFRRVWSALRGASAGSEVHDAPPSAPLRTEPARAEASEPAPQPVRESKHAVASEPKAQQPEPQEPTAAETSPAAVADRPAPVEAEAEDLWDEVEPDPEEQAEVEQAPAEFVIDPQMIQRPQIGLRNIIGVNDVKERLQTTVLDPLRARSRNSGNTMTAQRSGYLMFGPPGCGKGFFARIVAGEIGASYLPVKMSRALDWPGDPRQNIQRIFEAAREAAPCVLFLDEIDWAGRHRDAPSDPVDRGVVNRLVTELDTAAANRGVYVFAGADNPWDVDMALRAEGRLDQTLLVLPPDDEAREAILRFHLKGHKLAGIDTGWIVQRTQHFSGDDLLLLCDTAATLATGDALGGDVAIGPGHVTRALREVRPTAPGWFQAAVDQATASNHGRMYDDVLAYIDEHQLV
jgi:SpoVK/Ycf46/Vps4 family AAA+-type ATPase